MMQHSATIIRDAEAAYGLAADPARVMVWLGEVGRSLFTSAGQAALRPAWRF